MSIIEDICEEGFEKEREHFRAQIKAAEAKLAEVKWERDEAKALSLQMAGVASRDFMAQRDATLARVKVLEEALTETNRRGSGPVTVNIHSANGRVIEKTIREALDYMLEPARSALKGTPATTPAPRRDEVWPAFHRLWTKAVGTPDYVKREWQALEAMLGIATYSPTPAAGPGKCEECEAVEDRFKAGLEWPKGSCSAHGTGQSPAKGAP